MLNFFTCKVRAVNAKLPPDDRESALTIIEHSGPPSDLFQNFVNNDRLATVLAIYYTAQTAKSKDRQGVIRVFGTLSSAHDARTFADQYLHILVAGLICLGEDFVNEELCAVVFDEIFLPAFGHGSTVLHLMKLIWHVHSYLAPNRLSALMRTIESYVYLPNTSDVLKQLYKELEDRILKAATGEKEPCISNNSNNGNVQVSNNAAGTSTSIPASSSSSSGTSATGVSSSSATIQQTSQYTSSYAAMSPSPAMSPMFSYPQSPGPFSPMSPLTPMSPMPYQSPFHSMSSSSSGGSTSMGSSGQSTSSSGNY